MGYTPEMIAKFREDMSAIPELQMAADALLKERGVTDNLKGANLERARQSVINGIIDGAVYNESHSPTRDPGVLSAQEKIQNEMAEKSYNLQKSQLERQFMGMGYRLNDKGEPYYDEELAKHIQELKGKGKNGSGSASDSEYTTQLAKGIKIKWNGDGKGGDINVMDDPKNITVSDIEDGDTFEGDTFTFKELPWYAQAQVEKVVKDGYEEYYDYRFKPWKYGMIDDDEAELEIIPRKIVKGNTDDEEVPLNMK